MNRFLYLKNVATLALESEKCTGCGMCLTVCPHAVFSRNNGIVRIKHRDACMECGACAKNCPVAAISVNIGVGCAAAVINAALGRKSSACCCVIEEGPASEIRQPVHRAKPAAAEIPLSPFSMAALSRG